MSEETISGVEASTELQEWVPIFEKWVFWINDYAERVHEDVPYGDGCERALVGILYAAALVNGWQGLQEFGQPKNDEAGGSTGRSDLWLQTPDDKRTFYVEAKVHWSMIDDEKREERIENCLKQAISDAEKVKVYPDEKNVKRLGLAFMTMRGETDLAPIVDAAKTFRALGKEPVRLTAWIFPGNKRGVHGQLGVLAVMAFSNGEPQVIGSA